MCDAAWWLTLLSELQGKVAVCLVLVQTVKCGAKGRCRTRGGGRVVIEPRRIG